LGAEKGLEVFFQAFEFKRVGGGVFIFLQLGYNKLVKNTTINEKKDDSQANPVGFSNVIPTSAESHLQ
jgi:hypothetical protein